MAVTFAKGTTFSWNGNTVALLNNIGLPEVTVGEQDITTHQNSDNFRTFAALLADAGSVTLSGFTEVSDSTGQQAMYTDAAAGTTREAIIAGPNSEYTCTFDAFVTSIKPLGDAPIDGYYEFTATVKITGAPTFVYAESTGLTTPFFSISESAVITPDPANDTYTYVATVLTGVSSVTVTPTATAGTITVNGNTVATGVASSAITLGAAGSVTTITIIVTETSKSPVTYTVYLSRAAS